MLRGDHHGVDLLRLHRAISMLQVLDGHLRLPIWPQPPEQATLAHVRQLLTQPRGHRVRQGHAVLSLVARIPKHDALITSAHIKVLLAHVDTTRDVRALLVDAHQHLACLVAQALAVHAGQIVNIGVEADLPDHTADDLLVVDLGLSCDLASNHHHVVLCRRLTSHLALRIVSQASVQDGIRDLVAHLVRVPLVHRFGREKEPALRLGPLLRRLSHCLDGTRRRV
mmetsp:Transcript_120036/g.301742  ORF Transcript_120036/g.301742 Transcript_120036/m.301742 type:complete len:225 (-) Transcript_120036:60-734(-)